MQCPGRDSIYLTSPIRNCYYLFTDHTHGPPSRGFNSGALSTKRVATEGSNQIGAQNEKKYFGSSSLLVLNLAAAFRVLASGGTNRGRRSRRYLQHCERRNNHENHRGSNCATQSGTEAQRQASSGELNRPNIVRALSSNRHTTQNARNRKSD